MKNSLKALFFATSIFLFLFDFSSCVIEHRPFYLTYESKYGIVPEKKKIPVKTIINEVKNITDKEILKQKYKRLYEIYNTDIPYISLYHSYDVVAYSKNLAGSISADWFNIFTNISGWSKK